MAREFAADATEAAVLTALNVASIRALCQGGVSRNRRAQAPPYVSIGPASEVPDDAFGRGFGSVVQIPVHVVTAVTEEDGASRAYAIAEAIGALLDRAASLVDGPEVLAVPGWTVRMTEWLGNATTFEQTDGDGRVYRCEMTWRFHVRQV